MLPIKCNGCQALSNFLGSIKTYVTHNNKTLASAALFAKIFSNQNFIFLPKQQQN